MPWNDAFEIIAGQTGQMYIGPVGTAEPTNEDSALNSALEGCGYITEDGVATNKALEIVEHRVWQSRNPIRRDKESEDFQAVCQLVQFNEVTIPFALGGGEITEPTPGHYRYSPPSVEDALPEKMAVIDIQDGDVKLRIVIPRGTVTEGVEQTFRRNELAGLPVTFKALENDSGDDWYWLSNAPGFETGS